MKIASRECPYEEHPADQPKYITIEATPEQVAQLHSGAGLIQDVLPELSIDDRERFQTGYCKHCWDLIFADTEDD